MDVTRKDALGGDNKIGETITLREIANKAGERMMQERMEWMEKQMKALTAILHELRDERRRDYETTVARDEAMVEPRHQRRRNEEIPLLGEQPYEVHPHRSAVWILGEHVDEGRDQSRSGWVLVIDSRGANAEESELRQQLHNVEQECDQVAARDPDLALELEGEMR